MNNQDLRSLPSEPEPLRSEEDDDKLPRFTLIIPAHNEESRLASTLERYHQAFSTAYGRDFELLVVCNGCIDGTVGLATSFQRHAPEVRVIVINKPVGKGGALLEAFRAAKGAYIVFADADGATDPDSLLALLNALTMRRRRATDTAVDVVIGSRRLAGSRILKAQPLGRRVLGAAFGQVARALFGLHYADTQCGAKAFRKEAAVDLAASVDEVHWCFDVDLLLCARSLSLGVLEHPVAWADVPGSRLKVGPTLWQVCQSFYRMKRRHPRRLTGHAPSRPSAPNNALEVGSVYVHTR